MLGITCGLYAVRRPGPNSCDIPASEDREAPRDIWYDPPFMSDHPGGLTRDHVVWAYRLLLDRDPENEDAIGPKLAGSRDTRELRGHLMTSAEFQEKNRDYAHTNDRTVVIKELESGVRLFVDLSDHVIGLNIVRGRYETDEVRLARGILRAGDTAIDVGAHIGFFTMQMAGAVGAAGRVYAFEPFDANADLLEQSVHENRFGDRVIFRRAAVGAAAGSVTLTFPVETLNSGGAYLLRDGGAPLAGHQVKSVPIVALDGLDLRRPVRFIKMDVEGAEPQVIRGAERILREDRPVILSELHPAQLERASGATVDEFLGGMRTLGYRAQTLDGTPLPAGRSEIMSVLFVQ
jgi:FkbM family methyltransferase